jgi:enoyl-CoA hydratase
LVITGAPPAFCSGADTSSLTALGSGVDTSGVRGIYDGFLRVRGCSLPTVAAVNGPAVGAGFNLALACDVRLVGDSARFDTRFARIGLHPGGGHTWMLERAVGPQAAAAMVLFTERIDSERAVEIGLAWRRFADDELVDGAIAFAAGAADVPGELSRSIKATLRETAWQPDFDAAVAIELERQRASFESGEVTRRLQRG